MPIYEYHCPKCDKSKEVNHSMAKAPRVKCVCGSAMKRVISLNSFQLKGDGWFKTTGGYHKGEKPKGEKPKAESAPKKAEGPK